MKLAYSIKEVCDLLSVGRTTLYSLIGVGKLNTLKVGRRTLISAASLQAFVKNTGDQDNIILKGGAREINSVKNMPSEMHHD